MKETKKTNGTTMGFTPIKAQNGTPKSEPKSSVVKCQSDYRAKEGR